MSDGQTLRVREIAEILRCPRKTINNWLDEGLFPRATKKGQYRAAPYLIPLVDVRRFVQRRRDRAMDEVDRLDSALAELDQIEQ